MASVTPPIDVIYDPAPLINDVRSVVDQRLEAATNYASTAFQDAQGFLSQIQNLAGEAANLPWTAVNLTPVAAAIAQYADPTAPQMPTSGLTMNLPAAPGGFTAPTVAPLSVGNAPDFTVAAPTLDIPSAPTALTDQAPTAPAITDIAVPTAPNVVLPDVPTLLGINIPAAPTLAIPTFSGTLAAAPDAPANTFAFSEGDYDSQFYDSLRAILSLWVQGASTGLAPAVEDALWERSRARERATLARKAQDVLRSFASRGWRRPPGAMQTALQDAAQETQSNELAASREIAINQANLEQSNRRFAIEQAIASEAPLIQYRGMVAQRAFETAKFVQQVSIDIFNGLVQRYQADAQAYATKAQVFKTQIDAELSKLEAYKSELEGQKVIGELNLQNVEIYKAKVGAISQVIEIFKAQVEAANTAIQGQKIKLDAYASSVQGYDARVRAKMAEYQGYETLVRAQTAKVDLYRGQSEAYRNRVEGFRTTVEALGKAKDVELETLIKTPLQVYQTANEVYRTQVQAETARVGAVAQVAQTGAQVYDSQVRGQVSKVDASVQVYKTESEVAIQEATLQVDVMSKNLQAMIQKLNVLVEAIKGGSAVAAQLAASALSAVHVSAGISGSGSASASFGNSASWSNSATNSDGTSNSTAHNYNYSGNV